MMIVVARCTCEPIRATRAKEFNMGKGAVAIISLIVGLVAGGIGGTLIGGGAMAGAGAAAGISTGICSTMQAAREIGLLSPEQIDQVLNRAAQDLSGKAVLAEGEQVVGSAQACAEFMAKYGRK
jgi:hypothetical protein